MSSPSSALRPDRMLWLHGEAFRGFTVWALSLFQTCSPGLAPGPFWAPQSAFMNCELVTNINWAQHRSCQSLS